MSGFKGDFFICDAPTLPFPSSGVDGTRKRLFRESQWCWVQKVCVPTWSEFGSSIYNTTISSNKKNKWTFEILTSLRTSFWQNSSQQKSQSWYGWREVLETPGQTSHVPLTKPLADSLPRHPAETWISHVHPWRWTAGFHVLMEVWFRSFSFRNGRCDAISRFQPFIFQV